MANRIVTAVDLMLPADHSEGDNGNALYQIFLGSEPGVTNWRAIWDDLNKLLAASTNKPSG